MRILLTNDDGIEAEGLQCLRKILTGLGKLIIVAPDRERSASGHGITIHKPLRATKMGYPDCEAYSVNGTPADCVKLAVNGLMEHPPDIIVSGINSGANLGTDVLYSGTVSAAIEGTIAGIPSIAVSLVLEKLSNYQGAADLTRRIVQTVHAKGLSQGTILNINFPDIAKDDIKGIEITRLGIRRYTDSIDRRIDPRGYEYFWLGGQVVDIECTKNKDVCTDIAAVFSSMVSITPVHFDLTNYQSIEELKSWEF